MRTFIQYDEDGEIIAVLQTEALPEGVKQPFYLEDKKHGTLEVTEEEELGKLDGSGISKGFKVDVAKRQLLKKSASKSATKKGAAKKSAVKKGAAKKSKRPSGRK